MAASPSKPNPRRYIWFGLVLLLVGIWEGYQGVDSFRTGKPIRLPPNYADVEWWEQLGIAALTILLALFAMAHGCGWLKKRGENPFA